MRQTKPSHSKDEKAARRVLTHFYPAVNRPTLTLVTTGLIHRTYKVECSTGVFCLQRLHPKLATAAILADYATVTDHLAAARFPAPRLMRTADGKTAAALDDHRWRLTSWIAGRTVARVSDPTQADRAAALLGRFHRVMASIRYTFRSTHPLHDTPLHARLLAQALKNARKPSCDLASVMRDVETLAATALQRSRALALPAAIKRRVVHGDPKISNVVFDPQSGRAVGLIDLDTCTRHSVLVDLGDALRSWSPNGREEDPGDPRLSIIEAFFRGYGRGGPALTAVERTAVAQAGPLITWELCMRFLRDVIEDAYFGWDPQRFASRRAHNLVRARAMATLARRLEDAQHRIADLAAAHLASEPS
jgi:Ser/Thr protein kinase RdoA (MazF antagonist)